MDSEEFEKKEATRRFCPSGQTVTLSAPGGGRGVGDLVEVERGEGELAGPAPPWERIFFLFYLIRLFSTSLGGRRKGGPSMTAGKIVG